MILFHDVFCKLYPKDHVLKMPDNVFPLHMFLARTVMPPCSGPAGLPILQDRTPKAQATHPASARARK